MILYHGSNVIVEKPLLRPSVRALDFGSGFYMTSDAEQARRWAQLTKKRRGSGKPYVSVYNVDEKRLNELHMLYFKEPNAEWLKFISAHRSDRYMVDEYDIVIGPVADDNTMPVINLYLRGDYTEEEALKRLLPQKLKDQYTFKTEKAIQLLELSEVMSL